MKSFTTLTVLLLSITLSAFGQAMTGDWSGKLKVNESVSLTIVYHVNSQSKTCTLDSPDQGAKGISCTIAYISADSIAIQTPGINAIYKGKLHNGNLHGTFTQNGYSFPLTLENKKIVVSRPQTPTPPFPYKTEEVTFDNPKEKASLSGTLTYPVGYEKMQKTKIPIVIMVTGSGQQNRDEEILNHKPFAVIADYLARNGIASLRYDDRGTGKSTGSLKDMTTETNKDDALAAMEYIRHRKLFGKVGILGHSEGGMIAFMIAAQKKADFIVCMAAPAERGDKLLLQQLQESSPVPIPENLIRLTKKAYQLAIDNKSMKTEGEFLSALEGSQKEPMTTKEKKYMKAVHQTISIPWMRFFLSYSPSKDIKNTFCPVMAINGEKDKQVFVDSNLETIRKELPKNRQNLIKRYPNLNHLFQHCKNGYVTEYNSIEETISPEVLSDMTQWIHALK